MADTPLAQKLRARTDVPNDDVDDILEIAARRQDEARKEARAGATREELAAVAKELDIAPEHVEAAIAELRSTREREARAKAEAEAARGRATKLGAVVLAGVLALLGAAGAGTVGAAWLASGSVRDAAEEAHAAEARLEAVLERQASLAPQLAGLAGTDGGDLLGLAEKVRSAPDLPSRLAATDALSTAMATQLGQLPPPSTDAEATLRLQVHDELSGSQNRVTVELRRYREAEAAWRDAASGGLAGLAVGLGFAEEPP